MFGKLFHKQEAQAGQSYKDADDHNKRAALALVELEESLRVMKLRKDKNG